MTRTSRPGPLLFVGFWLLLMIGGRDRLFRDPGTFWHTRVGEKILTDGFFDTDPFSFTRAGEHWVPHQWLGEVALALAHRVAGFDTLLLLTTAVLAGLYTWLAGRLLRTGVHPILAIPVVAVGLAAGATHFHVRPHLMTIVGLAATAGVLTDVEAGRVGFRRLWALVPLFVLWSNVHGGMLGGLATLVLAGVGWAGWAAAGWPSPLQGGRRTVGFAAVTAVCAATAVVTPYGTGVPRAWLAIMSLGDLSQYVEEHAAPDPADPSTWPVIALAVGYLVLLAGVRERPRVAWLVPLFWLVQAAGRVRHGPLFAVVALVAIADIWPATVWARRLAARRPDLYDPAARPRAGGVWSWSIPVALVLAVAILQAAGVRAPVIGAGWARLDPDRWPVELLPAVRAHEPAAATPGHIFCECGYGGFLIYHAPGYRVFFDDRFELYGDRMLREFVRAGAEGTAVQMAAWQDRYGSFDAALVRAGGGFDEYFRSDLAEWSLIGETRTAAFYIRRPGPTRHGVGSASSPR